MIDQLYRVRIRPRGPWRTPWQADTLAGLLCWMCVRLEGESVLCQEIIDPMLAGDPPFVFSDAFPGDLLPIPLAVRLADWPAELRKAVKRAAWLRPEAFARACSGEMMNAGDLLVEAPIVEHDQTRNTLDRLNDTTGMEGSLFTLPEFRLNHGSSALDGAEELSIYIRAKAQARDLLLDLFEELAAVGFGADASVGKGAFDFPTGVPELEPIDFGVVNGSTEPNAMVVLSTFQPGSRDPAWGLWESFVKFGKLGPGLAGDVFEKRPLILLRPGACFLAAGKVPAFLGRAIPMEDLLEPEVVRTLHEREVEVIHPAFGLVIPAMMRLP